MDPLASSHTAHSCASRLLLCLLIFALEFLHFSISSVAGASASEIVQDMGNVSGDSLARLRIRASHSGPTDLLQRSGSVFGSRDKISPPAVGMNGVEGSRRLLGDISPPGMWPTPDGQDPTPPQEKFRRRSLLTGGNSPSPMGPWFVVMHSCQDGEDAFLRQGLVADTSYPLVPWTIVVKKLRELGTALNMPKLGFQNNFRRYLRLKNTVGANNRLERIQHGQQAAVVPDSGTSSDTVGNGMRSAGQFRNYEKQTNSAEGLEISGRSLSQGDISPPGMWPASDDEESEISESEKQRNLIEDLRMPGRSLLQGDISPPGMWPDSDDDESQLSEYMLLRRRSLLNKFPRRSLLQADISPPGMWPDSDNDGDSAF